MQHTSKPIFVACRKGLAPVGAVSLIAIIVAVYPASGFGGGKCGAADGDSTCTNGKALGGSIGGDLVSINTASNELNGQYYWSRWRSWVWWRPLWW